MRPRTFRRRLAWWSVRGVLAMIAMIAMTGAAFFAALYLALWLMDYGDQIGWLSGLLALLWVVALVYLVIAMS